ncbi:hypothetical protein D210916BOD24_22310 [Alteromonas sp. D210916BOD_24]|uniref:IclR family transcriptional regulator n=1 Tax=Alteromonas sp. D210916BOD_24 TaxID=3157618 RepID=UPI00399D37C6
MDRYIIPSVFQAIQLCEILATSDDGLRATDIEHALNVPRTTVFRLLRTLVGERVIEKKGTRYVYGRRVYEVNATDLNRRKAQKEMTLPLAALIKGSQCSALICIPSERCALTVDVIDASPANLCPIRAGTHLSLFDSAPGQIVLAYLPRLTVDRPVGSEVDVTLSAKALKLRADVCARGYAITHCDKRNDSLLAVPVFSGDGEFASILSLYFSEKLSDVNQIAHWSQKLRAVACLPTSLSEQQKLK